MKVKNGLLLAHLSVLFFALSGVIAKVVDQSAVVLTCGRSILGALALGVVLFISGSLPRVEGKARWVLLASGALLALHWICFYGSIKVSSVSIGVVTVSTFPIMTALVEPLIFREPWRWQLLIAPFMVLIGTIILLGFSPAEHELEGMFYGFLAAFIFMIVHLINKVQVIGLDGRSLSFIQLGVAGLVLLPFSFYDVDLDSPTLMRDIGLVIFLALVCTALAYALFIESMRSLSARTAAVLTGLEPVYAVSIAVLFLHESFTWNIFLGAIIIMATVVWSSLQSMRSMPEIKEASAPE